MSTATLPAPGHVVESKKIDLDEAKAIVVKALMFNFAQATLDKACQSQEGRERIALEMFPHDVVINGPGVTNLVHAMLGFCNWPGTWRSIVRDVLRERCEKLQGTGCGDPEATPQ